MPSIRVGQLSPAMGFAVTRRTHPADDSYRFARTRSLPSCAFGISPAAAALHGFVSVGPPRRWTHCTRLKRARCGRVIRTLWPTIWSVGLGSAAGGITRFLVASAVQRGAAGPFPTGTLLINVTGSLLLGFLLRFALATPGISAELRIALTTGFCGGYTTFSTFSYETVALLELGEWRRAALYVGMSVAASLVGAWVGIGLARWLLALREAA